MLIDTHAHLNFSAFNSDRDKIIRKCLDDNISMINVGTQYETSKKAIEIAENYKGGVFAAVGFHPVHLRTGLVKIKKDLEENNFDTGEEQFLYSKYKSLAQSSSKVIAIGEIGLDYYYRPKTKRKLALFEEKQEELLSKELELARDLDMPVIFHCRKAHQNLIKFLRESGGIRGVVHCFTGNWDEAKKYLDMGLYLGFDGIIYKLDLKEVIEKTPIEKILIETDSPYLVPPRAGLERNEPIFVKYIARDVAKIKSLDFQKVAENTFRNAKELFKI